MRRFESHVVALLAALGALGCAGAELVRGARDGSRWRELSSEHFVLRTDISADSARRLASSSCSVRSSWTRCRRSAPSAPASRWSRSRRARSTGRSPASEVTGQRTDWIGHATWDELEPGRMVLFVSPSGQAEEQATTVAHELAHALSRHVIPAQPRWFSEGLAEVLQSVALERSGKRWIGLRANHWEQVDPIPVRELMGWQAAGVNREWRYDQSAWALVRCLEVEQRAGFAELQRRLAAGQAKDAAGALSLARRAAAARPEDPYAGSLVGIALAPGTAERELALRRAVELAPEDPGALALLACEVALEDEARSDVRFARGQLPPDAGRTAPC
ncbi:MAG TPA: hypothetical protein VEB43_18790 [Anaeromyxobacter sp.]|nr:hypothetical protein [Anaeromyxobacter sp.]